MACASRKGLHHQEILIDPRVPLEHISIYISVEFFFQVFFPGGCWIQKMRKS